MKERLSAQGALTNNLEQSKLEEKARRLANTSMEEGKDYPRGEIKEDTGPSKEELKRAWDQWIFANKGNIPTGELPNVLSTIKVLLDMGHAPISGGENDARNENQQQEGISDLGELEKEEVEGEEPPIQTGGSGGDGGNGEEPPTSEGPEEEPSRDEQKEEQLYQYFISRGFNKEEARRRAKEGWPKTERAFNPIKANQELIRKITDLSELRNKLGPQGIIRRDILELMPTTVDPRKVSEAEMQEKIRQYINVLDDTLEQDDINEIKRILNQRLFRPLLYDRDKVAREERGFNAYESINEIANDIMIQTGGDFARDGKYALVKNENGEEIFQPDNFLRWVRNRVIEYHESDTDNPVDFFSRIVIQGGARTTSIGDMIFTEAMFTDVNRPEGPEYLQVLRDQVYMELWLFNTSRDFDAIYRRVMGDDQQLAEKLGEMYYRNTFTKLDTMDAILTLPDVSAGSETNFKDEEEKRKSQKTGIALRQALLTYYHITDEKMLSKIAGDDTALFNNGAFINAYIKKEREKEKEEDGSKKTDDDLKKDALKLIKKTKEFFENEGEGALRKDSKENFLGEFNAFSAANKDLDLVNETRERVRFLIMEQRGISYEEAKYAETFAFSMCRWTGLASRHDETATGYDAWAKVTQTENYRKRQSGPESGGIHGNPYSLAGFKRIGIDFLAGARALPHDPDNPKDRKSILEIIQGGEGEEIKIEGIEEKVKFENITMEKFGTDHILRTFKLYRDIIETNEFNLDEIVKIDGRGRVYIDPKKAKEWIDGDIKAMRYAYRTWGGIDYGKKIRVRVPNGDGTYRMETMSIAKSMWGRQVYREFVESNDRDGNPRRKSPDQTDGQVIEEYRREFWKRPLMYMIAAEIYAHRDFSSNYSRYNLAQVQKVYEWLENFSGTIDANEHDLRDTKRKKGEMFFTKEDIEWIRRASNTTSGMLYFTELSSEGAVGFFEAMIKSAQKAAKAIAA